MSKLTETKAAASGALAKAKEKLPEVTKGQALAAAGVAAVAVGAAVVGTKLRKRAAANKSLNGLKTYHLKPHEDGWQLLTDGSTKPNGVYETKKEGMEAARQEAQQHKPSQLIVHRQDGTVQETLSYDA